MGYLVDWILDRDERFRYQLLDRMRIDCDYFLGYGNRQTKYLWAGNESEQIEYMKSLWNSFDEKPEWLTWEEILQYEKELLPMEKNIDSERQDKLENMSNIYTLSKYGKDDYSFWVFPYDNKMPIQLDLGRAIQGTTLKEVFSQINEEDTWAMLKRADDYTAYPIQNQEAVKEYYRAEGYSERGSYEELAETMGLDTEAAEETAEDEEDCEI